MNWDSFAENIRRGRRFEKQERPQWVGDESISVKIEAPTQLKGKRGRIDIRLFDAEEGHAIIIELKATDWDKMTAHRVRPNALRHARQIWRYIETESDVLAHKVTPGIIYPVAPKTPGRKEEIETILGEQSIEVVWRTE
jgi:hypothetical protein